MPKSLIDRLYAAGMLRFSQPPEPAGGTPTPPAPAPLAPLVTDPPPGSAFSQQDVSRIATAEHEKGERKGKQAAIDEVQQTLGVSLEEAARLVAAARSAEDAAKTQAQRDAEAAAADRAAAAEALAAARADRHSALVERALTAAGLDEKALGAVTVPGITVESTAEQIAAAVTKLKTDVPSLFGPAAPIPPADPRPGAGGGIPRPAGGTLGQGGTAEFERRYGGTA